MYAVGITIDAKKKEIADLEYQIENLELDRKHLLERAKELAITQDSNFKIVEELIYKKKRVDVEALVRLANDKYLKIVSNIESRMQDKFAAEKLKAATFISQADVKTVIRDKALLAQIIPESREIEGINYIIVKR